MICTIANPAIEKVKELAYLLTLVGDTNGAIVPWPSGYGTKDYSLLCPWPNTSQLPSLRARQPSACCVRVASVLSLRVKLGVWAICEK